MTYTSWAEEHHAKRANLQNSLESKGLSPSEVVSYFDFDNMVKHEPTFCGLYATSTKCHDVDKLNCYLCGCPHFICADTPLSTEDGINTFSKCDISSRKAEVFVHETAAHCDCSNCTLPHKPSVALKHYEKLEPVEDTCSFLEYLRAYQLAEIFGKYKIF